MNVCLTCQDKIHSQKYIICLGTIAENHIIDKPIFLTFYLFHYFMKKNLNKMFQ